MNAITSLTQDMLIDAEVQEHLKARALELMADAAAAGFVVRLNMPTAREHAMYKSADSLVIAPNGRPGKTLVYPEPTAYNQKYTG